MPHRLVQEVMRSRRLPGENPGLVLERLAPPLTGQQEYGPFVEALASAELPPAYTEAFRRWQRRTPCGATGRTVLRVRTVSPLAIGLGEAVPGENGLTTLSPYGVPMIPGSALKGVVRAYCGSRFATGGPWGEGGADRRTLLGAGGVDGESGAVDFLDGWIEPGPAPFVDDVITAHHHRYYQSEGNTPPAGFDGPNPVHFAAVKGRFRVVVEGPELWLVPAVELLVAAMAEHGIGAKTRAGYGRLVIDELDRYDLEALASARKGQERGRLLRLPAAERLEAVERGYAGRSAEFEQALDGWVLGEEIRIPELRPPPHGLFDREDPEVRRAFAVRLRETAERRAGKGTDRATRFAEAVRSWLPRSGGSEPAAAPEVRAASTVTELAQALVEVPGFGAALEAWARRATSAAPFERLNDPAFRATNATKREVATVLGRDRILDFLPEQSVLRAELLKALRE